MPEDRVFEFRVRMNRVGDKSYPQYITKIIVSNDREEAGRALDAEMLTEIDTFHEDPDYVTWEEELVDTG